MRGRLLAILQPSPSPPPWVGLPQGIQQQDWFAPSAPNGMGWLSGLLACPQLLAGLLLGEETHLYETEKFFSEPDLRTYPTPHFDRV